MIIRLTMKVQDRVVVLALVGVATLLADPEWQASVRCPALLVPRVLLVALALRRRPDTELRKPAAANV